MKYKITLLIFAFLLLGSIAVAFDLISIKPTPLSFDSSSVSATAEETAQQYATRMLKDVTIGDISCTEAEKENKCSFNIYKKGINPPLKTISFIAKEMDTKQILITRDKLTSEFLTTWLNKQSQPTKYNIGGSGRIIVER